MTYEEGRKAVEQIEMKYLWQTIVNVSYDYFSEMMVLTLSNGKCIYTEVPRKDDEE
jgi:hypothetical protein